eukprot:3805820-Amphidinium_carterae.1
MHSNVVVDALAGSSTDLCRHYSEGGTCGGIPQFTTLGTLTPPEPRPHEIKAWRLGDQCHHAPPRLAREVIAVSEKDGT